MQQSPTAAETKPTNGDAEAYDWKHVAQLAGQPKDDDDIPTLQAEANARLIAAAPELLEALKATEALDDRDDCAECEGYGEPEECPLCFPRADDARLMRRAAIAKAEGR